MLDWRTVTRSWGRHLIQLSDQARPFRQAKVNAQKAVALDPDLAEAHVSLGFSALAYDWNYPEAEREFRKAIELRPDYATAHQYYAYYLTAMGDVDQAIAERTACRFDRTKVAFAQHCPRRSLLSGATL